MKLACKIVLSVLGATPLVVGAQQTATTQDGTINNIPKYSGTSVLAPSALFELNGNVGINNSNPQYTLDIVGNQGMGIRLMDTYGYPEFNSTSSITFAGSEQPTGYAQITAAGTPWNYGDGYLSFATQTSGTLIPKMFLSPQGNLGIGSFAYNNWPQSELSIVTGNANSETGMHIFNTEPTGYSVLRLGTDEQGGIGGALHQFNASFSADPASAIPPLGTTLASFQSGGLILSTWDSSAAIKFFTSVNASIGNERMRITPAGQVGIGTTTPSAMLEVNGNIALTTGTASKIVFPDGTSQGTAYVPSTSISTSSNGSVGIGTTNPTGNLDVRGNPNALVNIQAAPGNTSQILQFTGDQKTWIVGTWNSGNGGFLPGTMLVFDATAHVPRQAFDSAGNVFIGLKVNDATPNSSSLSVLATGNVGIGTPTPTTALEVNGSIKMTASNNGIPTSSSITLLTAPSRAPRMPAISVPAVTMQSQSMCLEIGQSMSQAM